ncbi:MAG: precorrin-6y C5,15-methyltransferase (decarboxylating) subunit CbiE [Rhizobiaceae bacterium]|nr:precorrin-6y C5,15-methyltransferase (decarboxylating) subunit CbiE [Rhizobiaceae bacterium]
MSGEALSGRRWLSIVGIGEDGVAGLSDAAKAAISGAEFVIGGRRHLALANQLIRGEATAWPVPFDPEMQAVRGMAGRKVCVLASGDPFLHGVGATIARIVPLAEFVALPAPSAFSLAASRLGWALQDVETISLHGRPMSLILPLLHPGRRVIALTSDGHGPAALAAQLAENGFGGSVMTVLEALGGPDERISVRRADAFDIARVNPLNVVAVEVMASAGARVQPLAAGLADDLFEHDGQITKREVRAVTLSALAPRRGELLWDVGAGSGSVGIEWMLADPSVRAVAVEADPVRAARIGRNAERFGVPGLDVVEGRAPDVLPALPSPDAIFIGGGGSDEGVLDTAMAALKHGGRLVANAVTLEMEQVLLHARASLGGELTRIGIARAEPVGSMIGWRSAMPVTQWVWTKR